VADHPLVLHPAVLAAGTLPVLLRPEDALAEQPVLLGPVGAVVDRLRLLDLAEAPRPDVVGAGEADADRAEVVDPLVGAGVAGRVRVGRGSAHLCSPLPCACVVRASALRLLVRPARRDGWALIVSCQTRFFSSCMFSPRPRI